LKKGDKYITQTGEELTFDKFGIVAVLVYFVECKRMLHYTKTKGCYFVYKKKRNYIDIE